MGHRWPTGSLFLGLIRLHAVADMHGGARAVRTQHVRPAECMAG
jgi:hypothetical protein